MSDETQDTVADAAGIVVLAKARSEVVANHLPGEAVRQHALEAVADLDAHLAIVRRDQYEHAVVLASPARRPIP